MILFFLIFSASPARAVLSAAERARLPCGNPADLAKTVKQIQFLKESILCRSAPMHLACEKFANLPSEIRDSFQEKLTTAGATQIQKNMYSDAFSGMNGKISGTFKGMDDMSEALFKKVQERSVLNAGQKQAYFEDLAKREGEVAAKLASPGTSRAEQLSLHKTQLQLQIERNAANAARSSGGPFRKPIMRTMFSSSHDAAGREVLTSEYRNIADLSYKNLSDVERGEFRAAAYQHFMISGLVESGLPVPEANAALLKAETSVAGVALKAGDVAVMDAPMYNVIAKFAQKAGANGFKTALGLTGRFAIRSLAVLDPISAPLTGLQMAFDGTPTACARPQDRYINADKDCENVYRLNENVMKFLSKPDSEMQEILRSDAHVCDYYRKLTDELLPPIQVGHLQCGKGMASVEVTEHGATSKVVAFGDPASRVDRRVLRGGNPNNEKTIQTETLFLDGSGGGQDPKADSTLGFSVRRYLPVAQFCCEHSAEPQIKSACDSQFPASGGAPTSAIGNGTTGRGGIFGNRFDRTGGSSGSGGQSGRGGTAN